MSVRKLAVVALLVAVPATLAAQRGGSGFGKGMRTGGSDGADRLIRDLADSPSLSKDLQKANPIELLLDKKKDLKLTSDEEKELKTLNSSVKDGIKPFLKTIDSVAREMKKTGEYAPTQGQMLIGRRFTREAADSVEARYQSAVTEAMTKIAEERRQPATELIEKAMEEQAASRPAGRGRGRGGRPPV